MTLSGIRVRDTEGSCNACGGAGATCRVQGGIYGIGTEWWRVCSRCAERAGNPGLCECCEKDADELRPAYQWEEWSGCDPAIYWLCLECIGKECESSDEERAEVAAYWGWLPSIERAWAPVDRAQ
jgi:hypothetical protein